MKKRSFLLIFPVIAILLGLLPQSVVMNFADYDAETGNVNIIKKYFSYFDMTPFGYGDFFPLMTAILTCAVTLLALIYMFTGRYALLNIMIGTCIAAAIVSVLPVLLKSYTLIGLGITLLLVIEIMFITAMKKNESKEKENRNENI